MDSIVDIINIHMCDTVMVLWKNTKCTLKSLGVTCHDCNLLSNGSVKKQTKNYTHTFAYNVKQM